LKLPSYITSITFDLSYIGLPLVPVWAFYWCDTMQKDPDKKQHQNRNNKNGYWHRKTL